MSDSGLVGAFMAPGPRRPDVNGCYVITIININGHGSSAAMIARLETAIADSGRPGESLVVHLARIRAECECERDEQPPDARNGGGGDEHGKREMK